MPPKPGSLLTTLSALALSAGIGAGEANAQVALEEIEVAQRCEAILQMTDRNELLQIAINDQDACSTVALQRYLELTQTAAGGPPPAGPESTLAAPY